MAARRDPRAEGMGEAEAMVGIGGRFVRGMPGPGGYVEATVEEFLGLSPAEARVVDYRLAVARAIRARREALGLSQAGAAGRCRTSQARFSRVEGAAEASLDLMARCLFTLGGSLPAMGPPPAEPDPAEPARPGHPNLGDETGSSGAVRGRGRGVPPNPR